MVSLNQIPNCAPVAAKNMLSLEKRMLLGAIEEEREIQDNQY